VSSHADAAGGPTLPTGTVTFLFTDLEGSTRLWEEHPDAMSSALARHDEILRNAVERHHGWIVKRTGDGMHAVFTSARDAIEAAVDAQLELASVDWGETGPLAVRMGCNSGEAELREGDYYGPSVNRAARIMAAAHGGQILCSHATAQLLEDALPPDVTLLDLGEHRLRDLARAEHVFQVQHPALRLEFPRLRSLDAYPTNLPAQRTSFIGREGDVDAVAAALRDHRVVTITGVGGVGKSRLAIQTAAAVLPRFPDGAWLCELAPVTDGDAVVEVLADAVGVPAGSGPASEALPWFLRSRRALIVMDNCDHVLTAVAEVVDDLLARCPDVRVLATSREALGLPGEQVFALGTLTAPASPDVRAVMSSPACQLFVERAQAARHDFVVDETNAAAIAALCERLDGIPLAIELAAARVRSLTPAQILDRLDERFRLLSGGGKARGRHQTLRGALAWSTDLLERREREAFGRLSVFVAPFDLEAAEAVLGQGAWEALDALVDKSLLLAEHDGVEMRYRMLETVREFAAELLLEEGDVADARTRHAHHYTNVATRIGEAGSFEAASAGRRDLRNIAAALDWLAAEGDVDRALRLVSAFESMYLFPEVSVGRLLERALAIPGALEHPLGPQALAAAASRSIARGEDPAHAYAQARASLDLAADLGVAVGYSHHLNVATTCMRSGHLDEGRENALAGVALSGDDPLRQTRAYVVLAALEQWRGDHEAAREAADAAERSARAAGAPFDLAHALLMQGYVREAHEPEEALSCYEESSRIALAHLPAGLSAACYSLANAARVRARLGDHAGMLHDLEQALTLSADGGSREEYGTVLALTGVALFTVGAVEAAAIVLSAATQVFEPANLALAVGISQTEMEARLREALGDDALHGAWQQGVTMSDRQARDFALAALRETAFAETAGGEPRASDAPRPATATAGAGDRGSPSPHSES
jgi:predicted ATPase/class 3 adenylate cyclase